MKSIPLLYFVTPEIGHDIESVLDCGVAGIAIISAIAQANCPKTATKEFLNSIRQHADSRTVP